MNISGKLLYFLHYTTDNHKRNLSHHPKTGIVSLLTQTLPHGDPTVITNCCKSLMELLISLYISNNSYILNSINFEFQSSQFKKLFIRAIILLNDILLTW